MLLINTLYFVVVVPQEAHLKVDICRAEGYRWRWWERQTVIRDRRATGGLCKALEEQRIPNLSTRLMCPSLLVPFARLVLTATEAKVSVSCLSRVWFSFSRIFLRGFTGRPPASECRAERAFLLRFPLPLGHDWWTLCPSWSAWCLRMWGPRWKRDGWGRSAWLRGTSHPVFRRMAGLSGGED